MNFFEQQKYLKKQTLALYIIYFLTILVFVLIVDIVILHVALPIMVLDKVKVSTGMYLSLSFSICIFLLLVAFLEYIHLKKDGSVLAEMTGAIPLKPDTDIPSRKILQNVAEELAIASGIPVPTIYVLEGEICINAFVSGSKTSNAALVVTRGAIDDLDREELQGLIAHEYSHIRNGDILINIKLMAMFKGMLLIKKLAHRMMTLLTKEPSLTTFIFFSFATMYGLTLGYKHFVTTSDGSLGTNIFGAHVVIGTGVVLFLLGSIGVFLSQFVKAQISKTREYLADASAIEFTRQTDGLKKALMKIDLHEYGSYLLDGRFDDIGHMLFASGSTKWFQALDSHPIITKRILKFEPEYTISQLSDLSIKLSKDEIKKAEPTKEKSTTTDLVSGVIENLPCAIALHQSLPVVLLNAAHDKDHSVFDLIFCLNLLKNNDLRNQQYRILEKQLGKDRLDIIITLFDELHVAGDEARLPLLEIALPVFKTRKKERIVFLIDVLEKLMAIVTVEEPLTFALSRVIRTYLIDNNLLPESTFSLPDNYDLNSAVKNLYSVFSFEGSHANEKNMKVYEKGIQHFFSNVNSIKLKESLNYNSLVLYQEPNKDWENSIDNALTVLDNSNAEVKQALIQGLIAVVSFDEIISQSEYELFRAICMSIHCPIPPMNY